MCCVDGVKGCESLCCVEGVKLKACIESVKACVVLRV